MIRSLGVLAQEKHIRLITENLELLPLIVADERRLYSAFLIIPIRQRLIG